MRSARVTLLVALLVSAGCTSTSTSGSTPGSTSSDASVTATADTGGDAGAGASTLDWGTCEDDAVTDSALECATLTVPLDYAAPDGDTIDLALVRVPAVGGRRGAILFNPGGPGGSGFDYIAQGGTSVSSTMTLGDFDLIGFDPRGVDRSHGLRCQTDAEIDTYQFLDDTPDTPEEQQLLDESDTVFEQACKRTYGDSLRFYSTENTARDMDAIRAALGDETISYLGVSYGTYLGATYATLFPDRVRAMVLDSAYEPTGDTVEEQYTTQLVGFEGAFDNWAAWCQADATCAFHRDDVAAAWDELLQRLDDEPLTATDGRIGNQAVMRLATISALYSETEWPVLADALAKASDGDASAIFRLADSYNQRDENGSYATIGQSNPIITCASGLGAAVPDDPAALLSKLQELAPRMSRGIVVTDFTDGCAGLVPTVAPPTLAYNGTAPIVVVGGKNDPATPFRWAEEMTAALGPSATLVTFTGEGHGQLLSSECVTAIEAKVLTDLEPPAAGTVCEPDPLVEQPSWWASLPVPAGVGDVFQSEALFGAVGLGPTIAYGELRTSELSAAEVIEAYDTEMAAAGFQVGTTQEPFEGSKQGPYLNADGELFTVVAIDPGGGGELADTIAAFVPADATLLLLLYLPG